MSLSASPLRTVVFDLETKKLAQDVGGWDKLKAGAGGISVLVVWDSTSGRHHLYDEYTLEAAAEHLEAADVVLSFNGEKFDRGIVEALVGRRLCLKQHLDLLLMVWDALPHRTKGYTLGEIGERTVNARKTGESILAPMLFDAGRFAELHDYCLADVHLTLRLFRFIQREGGIVDLGGNLLPIPLPDWFTHVDLTGQPPEGPN